MQSYKKTLIPHEKFYMVSFVKDTNLPFVLFLHGGPGMNCGVIEFLIEHKNFFEALNFNIILYDQRGCGRSQDYFSSQLEFTHQDNIDDLEEIYNYLVNSLKIKIISLIGHSYGAKLLYDYCVKTKFTFPAIFLSIANSILIPRLNNLLLDINYLKEADRKAYETFIPIMQSFNNDSYWKLSEQLEKYFHQNPNRPYLYWANLEVYSLIGEVQSNINLPINQKVFTTIRKDLYSNPENFPVLIGNLKIPYLWINGFQDYINGEPCNSLLNSLPITIFKESSHYPHLEENLHFCNIVNAFL